MITWRVTLLPYPPCLSPTPHPYSEIPNLWGNPLALVIWCEDLHNSISNSSPPPWHLICTALPLPCHFTHTTLGGHPLTCMSTKTLHQMQKVRQKNKQKKKAKKIEVDWLFSAYLLSHFCWCRSLRVLSWFTWVWRSSACSNDTNTTL